MREYKFRAWENGKMYYQVRCGGDFDGIPTAPTVWNESQGEWLNLTGQPHTKVMQYTGLKDRNGKEIYEGDVYRLTNLSLGRFSSQERYVNDEVVFIGGQFTCRNWNIRECYGEIIGNIYDNPDLLEG